MTSPETDSGFVGSETSRVSPLTQTPEHRLAHIRYPGDPPVVPSGSQTWDSLGIEVPGSPEQGWMVWAFSEPSFIPPAMVPFPILLIEGNRSSERESDLPSITQPMSNRLGNKYLLSK